MKRFFVEPCQISEETHQIHLQGADVNHVKNVLRMKPGEELWISDGAGKEYHCTIEALQEEEILLHILYAQEPDYELPSRIVLFQGLPKGDKMEWIIQKAVELGTAEIVPVEMRRCVVRLDAKKADKKVVRWQQIAESAAKQSKRMCIPQIHEVVTFSDAIRYAKNLDILLIPYELTKGITKTRRIMETIRPGSSIGIFIGPEGGLEEDEVRQAADAGAHPITLGRRILRTETAGMTVLSILMFHLEAAEESGALQIAGETLLSAGK